MAKLSTSTVFGDLLVDGTIFGNVTGNLTGNASTATTATTATTANTLTTARTISLGGLLSGSASFNGSGNITINAANAKPPKSGDWWSGGIPTVQTDGVMEIGKYIDFHNSDTSSNDYDVRLQATTAGPVMVNLPSTSGTIARVEDNVASATKLKDARTITIGNKGNSFDGTANISYSLSDIGAAPTSHNHNTLTALTGTSWTTATRDIQTDCVFEFSSHISKSATGLFPVDNNANAMISFNRHSGPHASQLGFSSNGKIYYRFGNATAITDSTAWQQIYTSVNKPTASDIGAAASSHGTHVTYSSTAPKVAGTASAGSESAVARGDHVHAAQTSVSGNAGTATKLATARTLTIGSTGKTFDGSANVSWTLAEIGAAASSHSHTSINYQDTRSVNTTPIDVPNGLSIHLKSNGADGISDGGSYHPVFMMKPWGDKSGWPIGQLTMTQNNNLYFRVSAGSSDTTWNEWKKVSLDGHSHGGTITAVNSNFSNATITNYDTIMAGINTNIGKL